VFGGHDLLLVVPAGRPVDDGEVRVQQVSYFLAIVRNGSFRGAATELGMTQSALSETVGNLERELGALLLHRSRGQVQLTDVGQALLARFEVIDEQAAQIRDDVDAFAGVLRGTVRIGTVNAGVRTVLPLATRQFLNLFPHVDLHIEDGGSADIADSVRSGHLDIGLTVVMERDERFATQRGEPVGLRFAPLLSSELVVCLPPRHPLAARSTIRVSDLADQSLITFRKGYLMHAVLNELLDVSAHTTAFLTDSTDSAKAMIAAGVGVTVLPEFSARFSPAGTIYRPLADIDTKVTLGVVTRSDPLPGAAREFESLLRGYADTSVQASSPRIRRGSGDGRPHSGTSVNVNTRS
jgi:DNA-binding transcriptional LysR family regulator